MFQTGTCQCFVILGDQREKGTVYSQQWHGSEWKATWVACSLLWIKRLSNRYSEEESSSWSLHRALDSRSYIEGVGGHLEVLMRSVLVMVASCRRVSCSRQWQSKLPRCESWQDSSNGACCRSEDAQVRRSGTDGPTNKIGGRWDMVVSHSLRCQQVEKAGIWFPYLGCFHFEIYFKLLLVVELCMCVFVTCVRTHAHRHRRNILGIFLYVSLQFFILCICMLILHACTYVCTPHACLDLLGLQSQLWDTVSVLGTEPRASARAASAPLCAASSAFVNLTFWDTVCHLNMRFTFC